MMRKIIAILICAAAALQVNPSIAKTSSDCMLGMRQYLVEGQFSGPIVCSKSNASFKFLGKINRARYSIFEYKYRFRPRTGSVMHGGHKIIVFEGRRYIGQFSLSPPPYNFVSLSNFEIIVRGKDKKSEYIVDFSKGPPNKVFIDGELIEFYQ